jgi:hypothetical protein
MSDKSNGAGGYYRTYDQFLDRYGPELDPISIAVYHYLVRCADKDGYCHPGYERIAYHCGRISRRSAVYAIAKLIKLGLIERRHRKKGNESHDTNRYKIRLEAFTDAALRGGVVHHMHEGSAPYAPGVVHQVHPKDNTVEGQHNEGERGGTPPSTPPDSLSVFSNSPQGGEAPKVGGDVEAATIPGPGGNPRLSCQDPAVEAETGAKGKKKLEAFTHAGAHREVVSQGHPLVSQLGETTQKAEESPCPSDPLPAVKVATKANGKPTTGRKRQRQGNGAAQPLPVPWALSDDDIKADMQETGWSEAKVKDEASKFVDHHLRKGTLSHDWQADWRLWKRRGVEWESREREHARANGKAERTAPRPPVFVAEPRAPIDPSKPRPSHMPMVLEEIARQERARRAAQP